MTDEKRRIHIYTQVELKNFAKKVFDRFQEYELCTKEIYSDALLEVLETTLEEAGVEEAHLTHEDITE